MQRSLEVSPPHRLQSIQGPMPLPAVISPVSTDIESSELNCAAIIRSFSELPRAVRFAKASIVESRVLKRRLLRQLVSQPPPPNYGPGWSDRISKREASLSPYIGKRLQCVLIRLPGVQYTVEVDPQAKQVVYWEWQTA